MSDVYNVVKFDENTNISDICDLLLLGKSTFIPYVSETNLKIIREICSHKKKGCFDKIKVNKVKRFKFVKSKCISYYVIRLQNVRR